MDFFEIVHQDILLQILSFLPCKDLLTCSLVCKEMHEICKTPFLWKSLCHSKVKNKVSLDPELHANLIKNNDKEFQIWIEFYKKLMNSKIIEKQDDLDEAILIPGMRMFVLPGHYFVKHAAFPPMTIIGLGKSPNEVVFEGSEWGVLTFEGLNSYSAINPGLVKNITVTANQKEQPCHIICFGRGVHMKLHKCRLDGQYGKATSLNIYGEDTDTIILDNVIENSPKHNIYVGQNAKAYIKGNQLRNSAHSGVHVVTKGRAIIHKNIIQKCGHHGVFVNYSGYADVQENEISDVRGKGVEIHENAIEGCIVKKNIEKDCKMEQVERTTSTDDCIIS